MSSTERQVYQWAKVLKSHLPILGYWQIINLALFSLGVVLSRSCQVTLVAEELGFMGKADTIEKRLKRFLDNDRLIMDECFAFWIKWVLSSYCGDELDFLVDETKLGDRMGVLMISLAYRQRAIPLIWRCYKANDKNAYPAEGQVQMIVTMLDQIKPHVPSGCRCRVQADQGIGNSSRLMRQLHQNGWVFLFRVKETSMFTTRGGFRFQLRDIAGQQRCGSASGWLFTRSHRLVRGTLHVIWEEGYDEVWFLFTNDPLLSGGVYARRFWHEEGFRDLKSGGWRWDDCFIRDPDHMQRLILVLALAYAWVATLGTLSLSLPADLRRQLVAANETRFSVFRQGIRVFKRLRYIAPHAIHFELFFVPTHESHPLLC